MSSLLRKAGALLLGGLGLGLLLANAALNHGCAGKRGDNAPAATPDDYPGYMNATKAPVMGPFRGSSQTESLPSEESAAQQAPAGSTRQAP